MSPGSDGPTALVRLFVAVVAGLLWALAIPPADLGVITAIAAVPLLLYAVDGTTVGQAVMVAYAFACTGIGIGCFWVYNVFGLSGFALVPIVALYQLLFVFGARCLLRQVQCWRFLEVACLWTAIEFFRVEWAPLGNGTLTVGSTVPTGLLLYPARHVGVYGLSFIYVLFGALLYRVFCYRREGKSVAKALIVPALLVVVTLGWGLAATPPAQQGRQISLLAIQAQRVSLEQLFELSKAGLAAHEGVQAVVWPEWALRGVFVEEDEALRKRLADFTKGHDVSLIFGNKRRVPSGGFYNTAFFMSRHGNLAGYAGKSRPVPLLNDGEPTAAPDPVNSSLGRIGLPICYDADFSTVVAGIARRGAEFFVIPTCDNRHWGWFQHLQRARMLRLRGIETGKYLLRVNGSGPTVVVGPDGDYREGLWNDEEGYLFVELPLVTGKTPYVAGGWLFAPCCLLVSVLTVLCAMKTRKSSTTDTA